MGIEGRVWKYGENVDTDAIIPACYLNMSTPEELGAHCMENIDAAFAAAVQPGDVVVAGENFGCGSSREHAALALKGAGVACVVAASLARIFFRNAINVGLPILECTPAAAAAASGHRLAVDLHTGEVRNLTTGDVHYAEPYPAFLMEIITAGGLVPYTRRRIER